MYYVFKIFYLCVFYVILFWVLAKMREKCTFFWGVGWDPT